MSLPVRRVAVSTLYPLFAHRNALLTSLDRLFPKLDCLDETVRNVLDLLF